MDPGTSGAIQKKKQSFSLNLDETKHFNLIIVTFIFSGNLTHGLSHMKVDDLPIKEKSQMFHCQVSRSLSLCRKATDNTLSM